MKSMAEIIAEEIEATSLTSSQAAMQAAGNYLSILEDLRNSTGALSGDPEMEALRARTAYWVDKHFLFKGLTTVLVAKAGTGKTHFGSWLILRALFLHPEWDIYTNIPFFWVGNDSLENLKPPRLYSVMSMSQLLKASAQSILDGRMPAVILDEMDGALMSQLWRTNQNLSWERFTFIERHLMIRGPLLLYHEVSDVPHYLRKGALANQIVGIYLHGGQRYVFSQRSQPNALIIDGPVIPYSTYGLMGFRIDVDVGKLAAQLHAARPKIVAEQILSKVDDCLIDWEGRPDRTQAYQKDANPETGKRLIYCNDCGNTWWSKQKGNEIVHSIRVNGKKFDHHSTVIIPKDRWEEYGR